MLGIILLGVVLVWGVGFGMWCWVKGYELGKKDYTPHEDSNVADDEGE